MIVSRRSRRKEKIDGEAEIVRKPEEVTSQRERDQRLWVLLLAWNSRSEKTCCRITPDGHLGHSCATPKVMEIARRDAMSGLSTLSNPTHSGGNQELFSTSFWNRGRKAGRSNSQTRAGSEDCFTRPQKPAKHYGS
jgi:hypothetical protein